jgi:hypothetical protein
MCDARSALAYPICFTIRTVTHEGYHTPFIEFVWLLSTQKQKYCTEFYKSIVSTVHFYCSEVVYNSGFQPGVREDILGGT